MNPTDLPQTLGLIAGKGAYPLLLAESARAQGVSQIAAVAFKGETSSKIESLADSVDWINVGSLQALLDALGRAGVTEAVMAGQITPTNLFRVRMDAAMLELLRGLKQRNAHTIFGALGDALAANGITLEPASRFMERHMPEAGVLTDRAPTEAESADIEHGMDIARVTSGLEIGQTVVIKEGTVLAVEAFEGTDAAITRAGKLGGSGCVVVKVAKPGHDMRFDIPVIGTRTIRSLKKAGATALAMQAGRAILLERAKVLADANQHNITMVAVTAADTPAQQSSE